jgi:chromosome segregation ATPase
MGLFSKDSKFSAQLFEQACTLMGLDHENTTEAELHQSMVDAGTIQAAAESTAKAAAQVEIDTATAEVVRMVVELDAAMQTATTATAEVETLKADAVKLESDLTAANSALATKVKEANTLAGEVARLTAGAKPKGVEAVDTDDQISKVPAGNGQMVKVKAFDEILN